MSKNYRVIEIISEKELIINYGANSGAKVGDEIRIYSIGEEVIDPESDIAIGTLDLIKDDLEIYTVYENFSICRKVSRSRYNPVLNPMANLSRTEIKFLDINIDKSEISNRSTPSSSPIRVGDCVTILK